MGESERLSSRGRRPARLAVAVQGRYRELHGREMALAITLSAFLSLLPLLLVGIAIVGFFSAASSKDLAKEVVDQLGLARSSDTARLITEAMHTAESSRKAASVVGLAGLLWTGLGVVRALQYAWNTAWQVPGRGLRDRAIGLAWLGGAGLLFAGSFFLSAAAQLLPWYMAPLGILAGLATGVGLWLWTARILPNRKVGWRPLLPGAVVGAAGFEILKVAVLGWLLLFGRLVVYSAVVEVVLWEERHGTVQLTIEAPARPGVEPLGATRAGQQRFAGSSARPVPGGSGVSPGKGWSIRRDGAEGPAAVSGRRSGRTARR